MKNRQNYYQFVCEQTYDQTNKYWFVLHYRLKESNQNEKSYCAQHWTTIDHMYIILF